MPLMLWMKLLVTYELRPSKPVDLDRADRQVIQLKIEQAARDQQQVDATEVDNKRLDAIADELAVLEEKSAQYRKAWEKFKNQTAEGTAAITRRSET